METLLQRVVKLEAHISADRNLDVTATGSATSIFIISLTRSKTPHGDHPLSSTYLHLARHPGFPTRKRAKTARGYCDSGSGAIYLLNPTFFTNRHSSSTYPQIQGGQRPPKAGATTSRKKHCASRFQRPGQVNIPVHTTGLGAIQRQNPTRPR